MLWTLSVGRLKFRGRMVAGFAIMPLFRHYRNDVGSFKVSAVDANAFCWSPREPRANCLWRLAWASAILQSRPERSWPESRTTQSAKLLLLDQRTKMRR
jgi:hypothetical protein